MKTHEDRILALFRRSLACLLADAEKFNSIPPGLAEQIEDTKAMIAELEAKRERAAAEREEEGTP